MKKRSITLEMRNYSKYLLSKNPFPYTPIPGREPEIFVNQETAISRLIDTVATTYRTGHSSHAVLIGPYGSGKSHALKYIQKMIKETSREKPQNEAIACYIPSPGSGFLHIYREFMERVGLKTIRKTFNTGLASDVPYNVLRISEAMNDNDLHLHAWRWFLGERLKASERSRLGVSRNLDDTLALSTFQHVIEQLRMSEYRLICLLIDELETVNELYPYQRQAMFNNLRRMIDDNPEGFCSVFACTPAGWDEILEKSIALSRRLSRNLIYLSRLKEEDAINLIREYLLTCRDLQGTKGKMSFSDLHPFTYEAAVELFHLSKGNIGELVKYCNLAIDKGIDSGFSEIDLSDLAELLVEFRV